MPDRHFGNAALLSIDFRPVQNFLRAGSALRSISVHIPDEVDVSHAAEVSLLRGVQIGVNRLAVDTSPRPLIDDLI